ncbi:MAG: GNAT family N-acetyltransferase [Acidobacteriota bacterium]|nr:GNAT family N-acetyltransferase [Acidobacteriota bacterium]
MYRIRHCRTRTDFQQAERIIRDYVAWLGPHMVYMDLDAELAELPGQVEQGEAGFLVMEDAEGDLAGGVGWRILEPGICEMKRFYVYPDHRGKGRGRTLCREIMDQARQKGYRSMRLDSLPTMEAALKLYREMGFVEIASYNNNPFPESIFLEARLS